MENNTFCNYIKLSIITNTASDDVVDFFTSPIVTGHENAAKGISLVVTYDIFALIGMVGMVMLLIYVAVSIARSANYFKDICTNLVPQMHKIKDKGTIIWSLFALLLGIIFNIIVIWALNKFGFSLWFDSIFRANKFVYIPLLCLLCSIFILIISVISVYLQSK